MKISEAIALIRNPLLEQNRIQSWCDLGCGTGTFTKALAQSLDSGSTILAVDMDSTALKAIPGRGSWSRNPKGVRRSEEPWSAPWTVDGILMANSLHFIQDQHLLIKKLLPLTNCFFNCGVRALKTKPLGTYPVGFEKLRQLFNESGVQRVEKLLTQGSRLGGTIYSAFAQQV